MIYVLVVPAIGFKNCCMRKGRFDGSLRNHFFPRIKFFEDARNTAQAEAKAFACS
jgi:hypothetical protein